MALTAGVGIWIVDAVIDSLVFHQGSLSDQILLRTAPHEVFTRFFFILCFILFGLAISRMMRQQKRTAAELDRHSAAIESSLDGIAIYNNNDEFVYVNSSYATINGYDSPSEIIGKACRYIYGEKEFERMQISVVPTLKKNGQWRGELIGKRKNGSNYFQEASITMFKDGGRVCIIRDVTWRKRNEERMLRSERFLNTIFNSIHDPFCILDHEYRIIRTNQAYEQFKNRSAGALIGRKCYEALEGTGSVCRGCVVAKTFHSGDPCAKDKLIKQEDGTHAWVEIYTYPILDEDGKVTHVVEYTRDITERKKSEDERRRLIERLELLSRTDALTGLVNRRALAEHLGYEIDRAKRYSSHLSLMLCDIDNFKEINDSFGHDAGDQALQMFSATLKTILRKADIAGRYGGDEFMLILPETTRTGAENLAQKILIEIRNINLNLKDGRFLRLSTSIGVAGLSLETDGIDSLIKRADNAMYNAKQTGRDRVSTMDADGTSVLL